MMRAALEGPPALFEPWRRLLEAKHEITLARECRLGDGLMLPHPLSIVLGRGLEVGSAVTLYHNISVAAGAEPGQRTVIGDGVFVHTEAVIAPGSVIGDGAVVGAGASVDGEVPAGAVVKRKRR
jgi:serine O-acetyltransferase